MNAALRLRRLPLAPPTRWAGPLAPRALHTASMPAAGHWRSPPRLTLVGVLLPVQARGFSRHVVLLDDPEKKKTFGEKLSDWRHDFGTVGIVVGGALAILGVVLFIDVVIPTIIRVVPLAVVGFFGAILLGISTVFNYIMRGGKRKEPTKQDLEKGNVTAVKAPPPTPSGASAAPAAPKGGQDEKPRSMTQHTLDPEDNKKAPTPPEVEAHPTGPVPHESASADVPPPTHSGPASLGPAAAAAPPPPRPVARQELGLPERRLTPEAREEGRAAHH